MATVHAVWMHPGGVRLEVTSEDGTKEVESTKTMERASFWKLILVEVPCFETKKIKTISVTTYGLQETSSEYKYDLDDFDNALQETIAIHTKWAIENGYILMPDW
jgi:FlaG/FlaF family flagellin (archaellin)